MSAADAFGEHESPVSRVLDGSSGLARVGRLGRAARGGARPRQALPDHAGDPVPAQDRRGQGGRRRELRREARRDARDRRRDRLRQEHDRPADHAPARCDLGGGALRRAGHHRAEGRAPEGGPARDADDLPGPLLVAEPAQDGRLDHRRAVRDPRPRKGRAQRRRACPGADGDGRAEPRALQPLPARVLRRPAPADRRGARAGAETQAADRR